MKRQSVTSSTIKSVGYDPCTHVLEIEFNNGIYQYSEVPQSVHRSMMESESVGAFFHKEIKNVYAATKL